MFWTPQSTVPIPSTTAAETDFHDTGGAEGEEWKGDTSAAASRGSGDSLDIWINKT